MSESEKNLLAENQKLKQKIADLNKQEKRKEMNRGMKR